jgi:iron complex outermembrane receptor protein
VKDKETDHGISNSPKHLAKLNVTVPLLKEKIFASTEIQYMSSRETVDGNKVDDFFVTNVTLFSRNLIKGLSASFSVYNLFDKKYRDPSGDEITQKFVEQDGRNVLLKLTYAF